MEHVFRNGFPNEREASDFLVGVFERNEFSYHKEYRTGAGRIDFVLHDGSGQPLLGIECKRALRSACNIAEFADPFEQCVAYANALRVPVLLAPIFVADASPRVVGHGGRQVDAYKTISIFAGRANVGGMFFDTRGQWTMMLRGMPIATHCGNFHPEAMRFVQTTNSKKLRSA